MKRQRSRHAVDLELGECATGSGECLRADAPVTMSFASNESNACGTTVPAATPESSRTPGPEGGRHDSNGAGSGEETPTRILAVDPEFDRVTAQRRIVVPDRLAVRDPELLADQVDPGDLLGNRVLDLNSRVHLEERDRAVRPEQELARARADVVCGSQDVLRR